MPIINFFSFFYFLPRNIKILLVRSFDIFLSILSIFITFGLIFGFGNDLSRELITFIFLHIMCSQFFITTTGGYKSVFRFFGWVDLLRLLKAVFYIFFVLTISFKFISGPPISFIFINSMIYFYMLSAMRIFIRFCSGDLRLSNKANPVLPNVLIYGAGVAGRQLADSIQKSGRYNICGYLDDNTNLQNGYVNNIEVFNPLVLKKIAKDFDIQQIFIALPSSSQAQKNHVLNLVASTNLLTLTLPSINKLSDRKAYAADLREIDVNDLLSRNLVPPDLNILNKTILNKIVLISGAGGSIGSEIVRITFILHPKLIILLEKNEFALYKIHEEILDLSKSKKSKTINIVPILGDVCDIRHLDKIFSMYRPNTVFHAAAYKHVPMVEHNVISGIKNNVFGTHNISSLSKRYKSSNFTLISTDKAVRPTNVMGATKRLAEIIVQAMADESPHTIFSIVRFGNVLESSGSVVPKFRRQIKNLEPVTITDFKVTRYFMTIREASELVIQASGIASGGEVFVLNMGEPIKIVDLAKKMIHLSGLTFKIKASAKGDILLKEIGLRPGEKLYEELLIGNSPIKTQHPKIMKACENFIKTPILDKKLKKLDNTISKNNVRGAIALIGNLIPEYKANKKIVDYLVD